MRREIAKRNFENALEKHENRFEHFFLAKFFDLNISYDENNEACIVQLPIEDYMYNPQGSLHGGVISFVLDVSMGHLCHKFLGTCVTLEMKVQFLRPAKFGMVTCRANFLKKGRTIEAIESRMNDENGKLIAVGTSTWSKV